MPIKRMAVLVNKLISNFAVWDGVQTWNPGSAVDVTSTPNIKLGSPLHDRQGAYTYNIVADGNSIARAGGLTVKAVEDCVVDAGLTVNDVINMSLDGFYTTILTAKAANDIDLLYESALGAKNICMFWEITNDLFLNSQTDVQAYNNLKAYCTARKTKGWKVIVGTCLPRNGAGVNQETYRLNVNQMIRDAKTAGETWVDAIADVGADAALSNPSSSTYYSDGLHLKDAGQTVAKNYFKTALQALL